MIIMETNNKTRILQTLVENNMDIFLFLEIQQWEEGKEIKASINFELEAAEDFAKNIMVLCMVLRQKKSERAEREAKETKH
jgi:hypothetical protein